MKNVFSTLKEFFWLGLSKKEEPTTFNLLQKIKPSEIDFSLQGLGKVFDDKDMIIAIQMMVSCSSYTGNCWRLFTGRFALSCCSDKEAFKRGFKKCIDQKYIYSTGLYFQVTDKLLGELSLKVKEGLVTATA